MKNVLLVINIILIILVGFLFYYVFTNHNKVPQQKAKTENNGETKVPESDKIAYIDLDSLETNYKFYQKIKADYEKKQNAANNEIIALQKKYQSRTEQLQQKAATMTPDEQEKAMLEINRMQQDFQTRKESLDKGLFDFNTKMKDEILEKIEVYLKQFNADGKYAYILSYEPGFMFYKDSTLNITNEVVAGLNAEYTADDKK